MPTNTTEIADRFAWSRARVATFLALLLMTSQIGSWRADDVSSGGPGHVHLVALVIWVLMLVIFVVLGAGLFRGARMRALINDETTLNHCRQAMALGFIGAIVAAAVVYLLTLIEPVSAQSGARLIMTTAIVLALLRFGTLEKRALKGEDE
jgi:FtsH-binding integral membrane protein